jgi:hypothetical protein
MDALLVNAWSLCAGGQWLEVKGLFGCIERNHLWRNCPFGAILKGYKAYCTYSSLFNNNLVRVRRNSDSSASVCCTAGPGPPRPIAASLPVCRVRILANTPLEIPLVSKSDEEIWSGSQRMWWMYRWMYYCMSKIYPMFALVSSTNTPSERLSKR